MDDARPGPEDRAGGGRDRIVRAGQQWAGRARRWAMEAGWRSWLRRGAVAAVALGVLAVVAIVVAYKAIDLPEEPPQARSSVVLDAEGNVLAELYDEENRVHVELEHVAEVMQDAVVAAEDRSFYRHSGLDPFGVARALWADVRGRPLQGGSTITQQLVKNTYLTPERSLGRKAREAILAVKVERELEKEEILERYLNTVYFGRGAYGIQKASAAYFGATAADLTLPQAALLAGLIRAPETADPARDPEAARQRRSLVLDGMVETGAVSEEEADAARDAPLGAVESYDATQRLEGSSAYFVNEVREWAVERWGERVVLGGGLRIHTTLQPGAQAAAEAAVGGVLGLPDDPDAALVALDENGGIAAMIGGKDFRQSQVNLALGPEGGGQGRQPGSTFKPVVLAAALDGGIPVTQRFRGSAEMAVSFPGRPDYVVHNYDDKDFGRIDLVDGMVHSVNTVYAQLASLVGLPAIADQAEQLGVDAELDVVPAMALGSEEVSPLEMATAYMVFARRGERVDPYTVTRVVDAEGVVLFDADPQRERVMARQDADVVNHVLQQVVERGTGRRADFGRPAAGKTGTTTDNTDAWFVGYTPKFGAAVWMGYKDDGRRSMDFVRGREVTGGSLPAEIWRRFMAEAVAGVDTGSFPPPPREALTAPQVETDVGDEEDSRRLVSASSTTSSSTSSSSSSSTTSSSSSTSSTSTTSSTTTTSTSSTTTTTTTSSTTTTSTTVPVAEDGGSGGDEPP